MLDLSPGILFSGLFLSCIGFAMFMVGKRSGEPVTLLGGIAVGALPMMIHALLPLWLASAGVLGAVYVLKRGSGF